MKTITDKLTVALYTALGIARLVWSARTRDFTIDLQRGAAEGITVRIVTPLWARVMVRNGVDRLESAGP